MTAEHSEKQIADVAQAYFAGVRSDLDVYGGVLEGRDDPLRQCPEFATAVFDELASLLANSYSAGELDFETADWLANEFETTLVSLLTETWPKGDGGPYPMKWSVVYDAFDAGEHNHFGRSNDPITEFTDPAIAEFLRQHC